jgi:hypothetical protein
MATSAEKRKAQSSIDDSSHRPRIVTNPTGTSGESISATSIRGISSASSSSSNAPIIQGTGTDIEASGTRFTVYSRCTTNGTRAIGTITSSEILSGVHENEWKRSNTMPYKYLEKVLDSNKNNVFVGKIGEEVCSILSFRFTGSGQRDATISLLWTSKNHRKKGYSTRLIHTAASWFLNNSFLHSGSTSVDSQQMCRSQKWHEVDDNSFAIEMKKLREYLEEKLRRKSTGSNDDWERTIDHNDILAVYTLPQQNSSSETTNQVASALQPPRKSSRRTYKREPYNVIGHSISAQKETNDYDIEKKESALKHQDPTEEKGRNLWRLSVSLRNTKFQFLEKTNGRGTADWVFYPSKHGRRTLAKLIARGGIQGVHYAAGYFELGEMVNEYGEHVVNWPNLAQAERSEDETIGDVQSTTAATSAAAHHPEVYSDDVQVDLTGGDGDNDDGEGKQGETTPGSAVASMRGSTTITAPNTANRVSLSPDHTRTAPIGTNSEQNGAATPNFNVRLQKLEEIWYGAEKKGGLCQRFIDLEVVHFGEEESGLTESRLQRLEEKLL